MEREPLFKRLLVGFWRKRRIEQRLKANLEVAMTKNTKPDTGVVGLGDLAERFLGQLPKEVMDDLLLADKDEPTFLKVLKHYAATAQVRLSTDGARQLAEMFTANRDAWLALMDYLRTTEQAKRFKQTLRDETKIKGLEQKRQMAQLKADIREADARGISSVPPKPKTTLEQMLDFLQDKKETIAQDMESGPVVEQKIEEILAVKKAAGASLGDIEAERRLLQDAVFEFRRDLRRKRGEDARKT